ncbi:MAG: TIM barrel protein [Jatrophihabitans sp.]
MTVSTTPSLLDRVAGAPISWGVCEAPGWGVELPAGRVLSEMRGLGLASTELGPTGYLGQSPTEVRTLLASHQLSLVGGFVPVLMHAEPMADLSEADAAMATLAGSGAELVVLAAQSADGSYDRKVAVTDRQWANLLANLDRLRQLAGSHGLLACVHPHVGTAVESRAAVLRLIADSDVGLCLDTGHLLIGGMQPLELLELAPQRVRHVHLKDVRAGLAQRVAAGQLNYLDAVRAGLYAPLGDGDVPIGAIVLALEAAGYRGRYVLEQDCALSEVPDQPGGPVGDVRRSLRMLEGIAAGVVA